jgi:hypothetical protein
MSQASRPQFRASQRSPRRLLAVLASLVLLAGLALAEIGRTGAADRLTDRKSVV